jgi:hypothetical protein
MPDFECLCRQAGRRADCASRSARASGEAGGRHAVCDGEALTSGRRAGRYRPADMNPARAAARLVDELVDAQFVQVRYERMADVEHVAKGWDSEIHGAAVQVPLFEAPPTASFSSGQR